MAKKEVNVIFIYSEMMVKEENAILKAISKQFVPGEVFIGSMPKKYTKMITEDELPGTKAKYPDTKIIVKGDRYKIKFTPPKTDMAVVRD